MYYGFIGLTEDFLQRNPGYFVVPVRISGSAIESVFSCLNILAVETCRQLTIPPPSQL